MIFLGCDAGSTKTEFLVADSKGQLLGRSVFPACNYLEVGNQGFESAMKEFVGTALQAAGTKPEEVGFFTFGLPTLGEIEGLEEGAARALGQYAPAGHSLLVNDSVLGWAGSLAGTHGINVVAGTGSIAYGESPDGKSIRVGGWSLLFDDPGSCAWIGRQSLSLFFQQADGRAPRGPLLDVILREFELGEHPEYFGGKVLHTMNTSRASLARVQLLAKEAWECGDEGVKRIYTQAIELLADMAQTIHERLSFPAGQEVKVSYSGGFFKNGECVLLPFQAAVEKRGMTLVAPRFSPTVGALALGARRFLPQAELNAMLTKVQEVIAAS